MSEKITELNWDFEKLQKDLEFSKKAILNSFALRHDTASLKLAEKKITEWIKVLTKLNTIC